MLGTLEILNSTSLSSWWMRMRRDGALLSGLVLAVTSILSLKLANFHRSLSFTVTQKNLKKKGKKGKRRKKERKGSREEGVRAYSPKVTQRIVSVRVWIIFFYSELLVFSSFCYSTWSIFESHSLWGYKFILEVFCKLK